jgi:hypothetical protein
MSVSSPRCSVSGVAMSHAEPSQALTAPTWLVSKTIGPRGACAGYASALREQTKCTERTQRCAALLCTAALVMRYEYH